MSLLDLQTLELPAESAHAAHSGASKNCASVLSLALC
jgi:Lanthionine-containing peptide SapB precursor RamS